MPDRMIREKMLLSKTLAKLSHGAERLFVRLTLVADDQGRFPAEPEVLKAKCFPLMIDQLATAEVEKFYQELTVGDPRAPASSGESPLVVSYIVGDKRFGYFVTWNKHQRIYGSKGKYPPPPPQGNGVRGDSPESAGVRGDSPAFPGVSGDSRGIPVARTRRSQTETETDKNPSVSPLSQKPKGGTDTYPFPRYVRKNSRRCPHCGERWKNHLPFPNTAGKTCPIHREPP